MNRTCVCMCVCVCVCVCVSVYVCFISYTYVYKQSKHSCIFLVLAISSLRYLLLSHLDDMFQPLHWAIFRSIMCTKYVGAYYWP